MTYTTSSSPSELARHFRNLEVDQQLALFWFTYKEMGKSITPAAPGASTVSPAIAEGLFNQVAELSQEEQLQLQRDLITGNNTFIAREYGALSDTTKLLFWYYLAQGMDNGIIVPFPSDFNLVDDAESLFGQIKGLDFGQQITFFRDIVGPMGTDPATAELDQETGL